MVCPVAPTIPPARGDDWRCGSRALRVGVTKPNQTLEDPSVPTPISADMVALFTACVPDYTGAALIMAPTGGCLLCLLLFLDIRFSFF